MSARKMVQVLPPDEARGHEPLAGARVSLYNRRLRHPQMNALRDDETQIPEPWA